MCVTIKRNLVIELGECQRGMEMSPNSMNPVCRHQERTCSLVKMISHIDGLMQERRNSIANALELRLSCINLPISCGEFIASLMIQALNENAESKNYYNYRNVYSYIVIVLCLSIGFLSFPKNALYFYTFLTFYFKYFNKDINLYLQFLSFLHIDMTQVVENLPHVTQVPALFTSSVWLLLMAWRRKEPGQLKPWYWPN